MAKENFAVKDHVLVPKHEKVGDKEKAKLLAQYNIKVADLPSINVNDPAISHLDVRSKDVIKVTRPSRTAGTTVYFRRVAK